MTQLPPTRPNFNTLTSTQQLLDALRTARPQPLEFWLDGALLVAPGYHVTEVKAVSIEAMDCGGQAASWRETVIQLMDGSAEDASEGTMTTTKFLAIYDRVTRHIPVHGEAEVRFEYGSAALPATQYHVMGITVQPGRIAVQLQVPGVQCKVRQTCAPLEAAAPSEGCGASSGCCGPVPVKHMTLQ